MLEKFKKEKRAAFIPYLVAGDPSLSATEKLVDILVEEGVDLLELGVPFSDALADGPVIQEASEKAAKTVDSMSQVLELAKRIHQKHPKLPLIIFTYYNPILKMGLLAFAKQAKEVGVTAVLTVDLPPEEAGEYSEVLAKEGLKTVFLISPTTQESRIPLIAKASTGFIYYVSRTGVTGEQNTVSTSLETELKALKKLTEKPIAVGFGISKPEHVAQVAALADAVVVGSAFVRISNKEAEVRKMAREFVQAARNAHRKT